MIEDAPNYYGVPKDFKQNFELSSMKFWGLSRSEICDLADMPVTEWSLEGNLGVRGQRWCWTEGGRNECKMEKVFLRKRRSSIELVIIIKFEDKHRAQMQATNTIDSPLDDATKA